LVAAVQDDLVPVKVVDAMLRHETSARVLHQPNLGHADFLLYPSWQDEILTQLSQVILNAACP
jgi:hypothetical protein